MTVDIGLFSVFILGTRLKLHTIYSRLCTLYYMKLPLISALQGGLGNKNRIEVGKGKGLGTISFIPIGGYTEERYIVLESLLWLRGSH